MATPASANFLKRAHSSRRWQLRKLRIRHTPIAERLQIFGIPRVRHFCNTSKFGLRFRLPSEPVKYVSTQIMCTLALRREVQSRIYLRESLFVFPLMQIDLGDSEVRASHLGVTAQRLMKGFFRLLLLSCPRVEFAQQFIRVRHVRFDGDVAPELLFRSVVVAVACVSNPEIKMHERKIRIGIRRLLQLDNRLFRFLTTQIGLAQQQMKLGTVSSNFDQPSQRFSSN